VKLDDILVHGEIRGGGLAMKVQVSMICDIEGLAWCSGFRGSMQVWAATQMKFKVLPFRVKIQGLGLCLAMAFLKALF
jgi:hypothetical protein